MLSSNPDIIEDFNEVISIDKQGVICKHEKIRTINNINFLISEGCIRERVKQLAKEVIRDFKDDIYCIAILRGSVVFFSDLVREIHKQSNRQLYFDFMQVSSYKGTESTGKINIEHDCSNIEGKDVLLIEDIVDTGLTSNNLIKYLIEKKKAKSVKLCSLLDKPSRREQDVKINYLGFEVPDLFVVGYGIDYEQKYRALSYVGFISD